MFNNGYLSKNADWEGRNRYVVTAEIIIISKMIINEAQTVNDGELARNDKLRTYGSWFVAMSPAFNVKTHTEPERAV